MEWIKNNYARKHLKICRFQALKIRLPNLSRNVSNGFFMKLEQKSTRRSSVLISVLMLGEPCGTLGAGSVKTKTLPLCIEVPVTGPFRILRHCRSTFSILNLRGVRLSFMYRPETFLSLAAFMMRNLSSRCTNFIMMPSLSGAEESLAGGFPMRCAVLISGSFCIFSTFLMRSRAMMQQSSFGCDGLTASSLKTRLSRRPYASNSSCAFLESINWAWSLLLVDFSAGKSFLNYSKFSSRVETLHSIMLWFSSSFCSNWVILLSHSTFKELNKSTIILKIDLDSEVIDDLSILLKTSSDVAFFFHVS